MTIDLRKSVYVKIFIDRVKKHAEHLLIPDPTAPAAAHSFC